MVFSELSNEDIQSTHELIESFKRDFIHCYPVDEYMQQLFIREVNSLIDSIHLLMEVEKTDLIIDMVKTFDDTLARSLLYSDSLILYIGIMISSFELLRDHLLMIEYYEMLDLIVSMIVDLQQINTNLNK